MINLLNLLRSKKTEELQDSKFPETKEHPLRSIFTESLQGNFGPFAMNGFTYNGSHQMSFQMIRQDALESYSVSCKNCDFTWNWSEEKS